MKVTGNIKCGCGSIVKATFKNPSLVQSTFDVVDCPDCESRIKFTAKKVGFNKVKFATSIIPSDLLKNIMEEEDK